MRKNIEEFCDSLDAAIFSGDGLHDRKSLEEFDEYLQRWTRELSKIRVMLIDEWFEEQNKKEI